MVNLSTIIPTDTILKEAYISGTLQQICKDTNLSYSLIVKRAKLENWPPTKDEKERRIEKASNIVERIQKANSPLAKGRIHAEVMARIISEKVLPDLEQNSAEDILKNIDSIEKADKIARRSYGLDQESANGPTLNINVLAAGLEVFTTPKEKIVLDINEET